MKILLAISMCVLACNSHAIDPWMFPLESEASASSLRSNIRSLTVLETYVETEGVKTFEGNQRVIHSSVANFQQIVNWYSEKIGEPELSKSLKRFTKEGLSDLGGRGWGFLESDPKTPSTHLVSRFLPNQKQITILHTEENGDVVTVSLLGLKDETSIHVLRRRLK